MEIAGYRMRDRLDGCSGPVTVHRAERLGRPGRLVRLTWLTGTAAGSGAETLVERWRTITHPALLAITSVERDGDGLLLTAPLASARPLGTIDPDLVRTGAVALARIGTAISTGLRALHDDGLVHGAVDSHTILLAADGTAVLDGPWHATCVAAPGRAASATTRGATGPSTSAEDDVRALAITLLEQLDGRGERDDPAVTALRTLLEDQRDHPGSAAAMADALAGWLERPSGRSPRPEPASTPAEVDGPSSHPALPVTHARAHRTPEPRARTAGRRGHAWRAALRRRAFVLPAIVAVLILGLGSAWLRWTPATSDAAPSALPSVPADATQSAASAHRTGDARPAATAASTRRVCPGTVPPPGPGRLVLADLDGRGCRAPLRVDGGRLALHSAEGAPLEVVLDLAVGDQVRVGDLDGSGRDEVVVYRPDTGEAFRFDGLAAPEEERVATGVATGWRGGTAVLVPADDGTDRLEVRGGTPA
jgi:hypothetical protein